MKTFSLNPNLFVRFKSFKKWPHFEKHIGPFDPEPIKMGIKIYSFNLAISADFSKIRKVEDYFGEEEKDDLKDSSSF